MREHYLQVDLPYRLLGRTIPSPSNVMILTLLARFCPETNNLIIAIPLRGWGVETNTVITTRA